MNSEPPGQATPSPSVTARGDACPPGDEIGRKRPARLPVFSAGNRSEIVFVTICTKDRKAILANDSAHRILREAWRDADHFLVGRYVIMPDHIHLFASPSTPEHSDIMRWTGYWKRLTTQAWPERKDLPLWQTRCWDTQLRAGESYSAKWDYVTGNPVRHGLVTDAEDWPYRGEINCFEWHER